jgi:hypothetical protein
LIPTPIRQVLSTIQKHQVQSLLMGGQACVFYDAPSGQARVLGGGFIRSASASRAVRAATQETMAQLAEAVRG